MIAKLSSKSIHSFVTNCQIVFQGGCTILHSHQQSSSRYSIVRFLDFSHTRRWAAVSPSCFHLQFPNDKWWWASFHMLICHLYILFGAVSVQIFGLFFKLGCFLIVEFYFPLLLKEVNKKQNLVRRCTLKELSHAHYILSCKKKKKRKKKNVEEPLQLSENHWCKDMKFETLKHTIYWV